MNDKNTSFSEKRRFEFNGKTIDFTRPRVMGIVNLTPDSFYDGWERTGMTDLLNANSKLRTANWLARTEQMLIDGAYIIDLGAVSTRPGAAEITSEEEKSRLLPVLKEIRKKYPQIIVSVDTFRADIARVAAGEGADIINDISGGNMDPQMLPAISDLTIPYIIMHMQGTPATMQANPVYDDVVEEVKGFLLSQVRKLKAGGHNKVIIDPGFGFGKAVDHNFALLGKLEQFVATGFPVLAGLSRKSMINRVLNTKPAEALNGTTVLNTIALLKGASILRVHDVKEAVETVKLVSEISIPL